MIYLVLQTILGSSFILCVRWSQQRDNNVLTIGIVNYVVGAIASVFWFLVWGKGWFTPSVLLTGGLNGICYFCSFLLLIVIVSVKGAAITTIIARLSILLPILYGILVWSERPSVWQSIGILLAMTSLGLVGNRRTNVARQDHAWYVAGLPILFFLLAGTGRISQDMFNHLCQPEQRPAHLAIAFSVAAVPSTILFIVRRQWPTVVEWVMGTILGLINVIQVYCLLKALQVYPDYIVFPVTSAAALVFTTLMAVWMLKERLRLTTYAGIGFSVCALVLLFS